MKGLHTRRWSRLGIWVWASKAIQLHEVHPNQAHPQLSSPRTTSSRVSQIEPILTSFRLLRGSQPCPLRSPRPRSSPALTHFRVSCPSQGLCPHCCTACKVPLPTRLSHLLRDILPRRQALPGSGPPRHPDVFFESAYHDDTDRFCRPQGSTAGCPEHLHCSRRQRTSADKNGSLV